MRALGVLVVLLAVIGAWAEESISVVRKTLDLEVEHTLLVDQSLEYIIQFLPNAEQSQFPMRVWISSDAGDVTRPLLLTARQRTGAVTWQLPYFVENSLLSEMERTLCSDDSVDNEPSDCAGEEVVNSRRGEFTLHVSSSCAIPANLRLRVAPARDWRITDTVHLTATMAAPRVNQFKFLEEQDSVRLVVSSPDDICARVAVHPYTCPIAQTYDEIELSIPRMTVLRSGGLQLSKARYPRGFYVIAIVAETDVACSGEEEEQQDWLWESVWQLEGGRDESTASKRLKQLTYQIKPSLTRRQYIVGLVVTLAFFLAFYVTFGLLVLAERWPRWYNCVAPKAVLAIANDTEAGMATELETTADAAIPSRNQRRRRGSTATFDSSDASDTDSEDEVDFANEIVVSTTTAITHTSGNVSPNTIQPVNDISPDGTPGVVATDGPGAPVTNGRVATESGREGQLDARPFGLPAQLRVDALARRHNRVLHARSQRYLHTLYTVAVFYALPVLQFVAAFQVILNVSGSLDLCYYNFLCAHPLGALSDFNHVFSNLGYLLLGALYMLQLRRRKKRRDLHPRSEEYGIPTHYGLSMSLGAGLMVVALLSASYHVCPNGLNFQFDTAFMYVLAVLSMVRIYQSRHPDINARAHATFGVLAVLILLVVWGVLGGGPLFWSIFTVLHVFTFLLLSLRIYYVGQFRLEKASLFAAAASLRARAPLYTPRLVALLVANAVNWAFAIYGLVNQAGDIASHLLFILLCNALLHMVFYLSMKLLHGERPRWYAWLYLAGAAATWVPALYFFTSGSTDWSATAAQSRLLNHECRVLQFYDSHDLWHMLSAVALYLTFNAMLTWDDGLAAVKRNEIAVF